MTGGTDKSDAYETRVNPAEQQHSNEAPARIFSKS